MEKSYRVEVEVEVEVGRASWYRDYSWN